MSGVFRTIDHPPPLQPARVYPLHGGGGRTHSPGGEGVWGSIFRKTPDIGLASYSIIPLRLGVMALSCGWEDLLLASVQMFNDDIAVYSPSPLSIHEQFISP